MAAKRSARSRTWYIWRDMIKRCHNTAAKDYPRYGGRGVHVCDSWKASFDAFLADMGERPDGRTIDRIDGSRGYEPGNCRWASDAEQRRNKSTVRYVGFRGEQVAIQDLAHRFGIPYDTLWQRLKRWDVERAVATPVRQSKRTPEAA